MEEIDNNSERFWAFMLPITTAMTIACSVMIEHLGNQGEVLQLNRMMQSALVLGLFAGALSILGLRTIVYYAIDNHHRFTAGMLSFASLLICGCYIMYGILSLSV